MDVGRDKLPSKRTLGSSQGRMMASGFELDTGSSFNNIPKLALSEGWESEVDENAKPQTLSVRVHVY